jgi:hypothetical protein
MAEGEAEEEAAAAALRRLVGQIQELCDLYGSPPFFSLHNFKPASDPRFAPSTSLLFAKANTLTLIQVRALTHYIRSG